MGTIVAGYVPKPEGHAAVERALAEAQLRGARLVVVNSHHGGDSPEQARELETQLDGLRLRLNNTGIDYEIQHLASGFDAAEDLVKAAETLDAELLVIGLRRRTPVGKLILGSNAQKILLDAPCPVLAVKSEG